MAASVFLFVVPFQILRRTRHRSRGLISVRRNAQSRLLWNWVRRFVRADLWNEGSKPTVGSDYSIAGTTKSFCRKLDEFHLFIVNLPCNHCWKDLSITVILQHTNHCARKIVAI